jgi:hypothetical protein
MARTKQTAKANEPPRKRQKTTSDTEQSTTLIADCWSLVFDFLCQDDIARIALVCKFFNATTSTTIQAIKEFVNRRSKAYLITKGAFDEDQINPENVDETTVTFLEMKSGEEDDEDDDFDESDANGAYTLAEHNGKVSMQGTVEDSDVEIDLQPVATKLAHLFKDGDIICNEKDEDYGYRNGGKYIYFDGQIRSLTYNIGDDYGICPSYFPLEKFPVKYFTNNIDHNKTRITKINQNNAVMKEVSAEKKSEEDDEEKEDEETEEGEETKKIVEYYVRYNHTAPFNIRYTITLNADVEEPLHYIMGECISNFRLG